MLGLAIHLANWLVMFASLLFLQTMKRKGRPKLHDERI